MPADPSLTAQLLALIALLAATIEYCEVLRRRQARRRVDADAREAADTGLLGLVRVLIADQ